MKPGKRNGTRLGFFMGKDNSTLNQQVRHRKSKGKVINLSEDSFQMLSIEEIEGLEEI